MLSQTGPYKQQGPTWPPTHPAHFLVREAASSFDTLRIFFFFNDTWVWKMMQPLPGGCKGNKGLTSQGGLKSQSSIFFVSLCLSYQLPLDRLCFVRVCKCLYPSCDYLGTLFSYLQYKKHLTFLRWKHLNIYA